MSSETNSLSERQQGQPILSPSDDLARLKHSTPKMDKRSIGVTDKLRQVNNETDNLRMELNQLCQQSFEQLAESSGDESLKYSLNQSDIDVLTSKRQKQVVFNNISSDVNRCQQSFNKPLQVI